MKEKASAKLANVDVTYLLKLDRLPSFRVSVSDQGQYDINLIKNILSNHSHSLHGKPLAACAAVEKEGLMQCGHCTHMGG